MVSAVDSSEDKVTSIRWPSIGPQTATYQTRNVVGAEASLDLAVEGGDVLCRGVESPINHGRER